MSISEVIPATIHNQMPLPLLLQGGNLGHGEDDTQDGDQPSLARDTLVGA